MKSEESCSSEEKTADLSASRPMITSNLKRWTHSLVAVLVAIPMMLSTQGCTDDEVAASLGAIVIVAGAVAVGVATDNDRNHHREKRCRSDRRERCTSYRDRRGRHRRECRSVDRSCSHYAAANVKISELAFLSGFESEPTLNFSAAAQDGVDVDTAELASRYQLSFSAAERLTNALQGARLKKDLQPILDLGLSRDDVESLSQLKPVSETGLSRLAGELDTDVVSAKNLISGLLRDFKNQAADVKSDYWVSCLKAQSWKTPQNNWCQSARWPGCSPETGASACLASL